MSKLDAQRLLKELESHMQEMPMHLYMLIWAISEMSQRFSKSPKEPAFVEICYPHTGVPLFSKEEASSLEDLWRKNICGKGDLFAQKGGMASISELKKKMAAAGQTMEIALNGLDPKLISPDYLYGYTTEMFDSVDSKLAEASGTLGLVALETTMPDPQFVIPAPTPIPVIFPGRAVLPLLNALLEAIRITIGIVFHIDPLGIGNMTRSILTLLMVCLDLGRGNLYHAIFTSFGFIGTTPMFVGIGLKIIRDAIMLVAPDLRTEMRDLLFESSKSFTLGFSIWLFTTLSPQFVKAPLRALFDTTSQTLQTINEQFETTEDALNKSPVAAIAHIKLPRIPTDKIPDINNLYSLREAVRVPALYCDPKIADLMNSLRNVPPYALFFDLARIPAPGTPEFAEKCVPFKGKTMSDNLVSMAKPQIYPIGSDLPLVLTADPTKLAQDSMKASPFGAAATAMGDPAAALKASPFGAAATAMGDPAAALKASPFGAAATAMGDPAAAATKQVMQVGHTDV
jgi:hypothetical protein